VAVYLAVLEVHALERPSYEDISARGRPSASNAPQFHCAQMALWAFRMVMLRTVTVQNIAIQNQRKIFLWPNSYIVLHRSQCWRECRQCFLYARFPTHMPYRPVMGKLSQRVSHR
jgi:hypothetical protein